MPKQNLEGAARPKRFSGLRKLCSMLLIVSTLFISVPTPAYALGGIGDAIGDAIGGVVDSVVGSVLGSVLGAIPGLGFISGVLGLSSTLASFAGAFGPVSNLTGLGIGIPYAEYMGMAMDALDGLGSLTSGLEAAERVVQAGLEAQSNPTLQPEVEQIPVEDTPMGVFTGNLSTKVGAAVGTWIDKIVKTVLYGILVAEGFLVDGAVKVFALVVDAQILTNIFNGAGQQLYNMWGIMRDLVSFFFILVLVFIGFATIFQVDSYNYRRMLLPLVLSALLVNFSWPISRAVMDAGNIPMYWMLQQMSGGGGNSQCQYNTGVESILGNDLIACPIKLMMVPPSAGEAQNRSYGFLIFSIIYLFIFAISLIIIAIQLFIRVVALALIMVISPIGFVGMILPGARSLGGRWWHALFQYTFFGPVVVLLLLIAGQFVFIVGSATPGGFAAFAQFPQDAIASMNNGVAAANIGSSLVILSIPLIVLFYAIKLGGIWSIAAAGTAVGLGYGAGRFIGKVAQSPAKGAWMGMRATGIPGGIQKAWQAGRLKGTGWINPNTYKKATQSRESYMAARFAGASPEAAKEIVQRQKIEAQRKYNKDVNVGPSQLKLDMASNDPIKARAAIEDLAERDEIETPEILRQTLKAVQTNASINPKEDGRLSAKILEKADKTAFDGLNSNEYLSLISSDVFKDNPDLQKSLNKRLDKENLLKIVIDGKAEQYLKEGKATVKDSSGKTTEVEIKTPEQAYKIAFEEMAGSTSPTDLVRQKGIIDDPKFISYAKENWELEDRKNLAARASGPKAAKLRIEPGFTTAPDNNPANAAGSRMIRGMSDAGRLAQIEEEERAARESGEKA